MSVPSVFAQLCEQSGLPRPSTPSKQLFACETCGLHFEEYKSWVRAHGIRRYCSMKCRPWSGSGHPRYDPLNGWVNCRGCASPFKIKPAAQRAGKGRSFCTPECRAAHVGKVENKCMECGNGFMIHRCQSKRAKCCSKSCSSTMSYRTNGQVNKGKQRGLGGKRADLGNMYFRSSWEANYARYLNWQVLHGHIKSWTYEEDTFEFVGIKRGTRFYTPDFKLTKNDGSIEYHEVKGWMSPESVTRAARMAKYYPEIAVLIIGSKWFRANASKLQCFIPNWEKYGSTNLRLY